VADSSRSRSSSWGASIGIQQGGWSIGADASRSSANATVFSNAQVTSGRNAVFVAGQDITLAGANVAARNVSLDAGRDLVLISQQNVATSNAWSFNVSVTFQGATPTGGSLGGSFSEGSRQYTDTPTTVIADERLDAYAGRNTVLAGAGMWSKTGKLKLDTGDLVFDNYVNRDTFVAVSGSVSAGVNRPWDASFSARYRNEQGLTFATLGAGDLNIRNRPRLDLSGLNRDVANMTRVTSSTSWAFAIPSLNLAKLQQDIQNSANYVNALTANVPQKAKDEGEHGVKLFQTALLYGMSQEQARAYLGSPVFQEHLRARRSYEAIKMVRSDPESVAFGAFLVMQGERLYFDHADGQLKMAVDCAQHGAFSAPCGRPVKELAQKIKSDPREASTFVARFIDEEIANLSSLKGMAADLKFDDIFACATTWAMLTGDAAPLDRVMAMAPVQRSKYLTDFLGQVRLIVVANGGGVVSPDKIIEQLPTFYGADSFKFLRGPSLGKATLAAGASIGVLAGALDGPYQFAPGQVAMRTDESGTYYAFRNALTGEFFWLDPTRPHTSAQYIGAALDIAGLAMTGGLVTTAPAGVMTSGLVRRTLTDAEATGIAQTVKAGVEGGGGRPVPSARRACKCNSQQSRLRA
jgi:hypothetical protein